MAIKICEWGSVSPAHKLKTLKIFRKLKVKKRRKQNAKN